MIKLCHDNILVKEIVKDSNAGVLKVMQDESSAYMYFEVLDMSFGAACDLDLLDYNEEKEENYIKDTSNIILITHRVAKIPFIDNKYFIDAKDVIAVVDKEFMEEI